MSVPPAFPTPASADDRRVALQRRLEAMKAKWPQHSSSDMATGVVEILQELTERDKDRSRRLKEIAKALGEAGTQTSLEAIRNALRDALEELAK